MNSSFLSFLPNYGSPFLLSCGNRSTKRKTTFKTNFTKKTHLVPYPICDNWFRYMPTHTFLLTCSFFLKIGYVCVCVRPSFLCPLLTSPPLPSTHPLISCHIFFCSSLLKGQHYSGGQKRTPMIAHLEHNV